MNELLRDAVRRLDGLFVGMLSDDELEIFDEAVKRHIAIRWYEGAGGMMGLAKVRLIP